MIDEVDKFLRMIYTMTLSFDEKKEKLNGDKLQINYIRACLNNSPTRKVIFKRCILNQS